MRLVPFTTFRPDAPGKARMRAAIEGLRPKPRLSLARIDAWLAEHARIEMRRLECSYSGPLPADEIERVHAGNPEILKSRMSTARLMTEFENSRYHEGKLRADQRRERIAWNWHLYRASQRQLRVARAWAAGQVTA